MVLLLLLLLLVFLVLLLLMLPSTAALLSSSALAVAAAAAAVLGVVAFGATSATVATAASFVICSFCFLVSFLPPKQQVADDDRGRGGVPRAGGPLRSELRFFSSLTSSVLLVIVGDSLWTLPTASPDARAGEICPR